MQDNYSPNSKTVNRGFNEQAANPDGSLEHVQGLQQANVSELPVLQSPDSLYRKLDGSLVGAVDEIKALEAVKIFADRFDVLQDDVRPCIAYMLTYGVSDKRDDCAFALANELHCLSIDETVILRALIDFNEKLPRPIKSNQLKGKVQRVVSYSKNGPISCTKPFMAAYCIGEELCAWRKARATGRKYPAVSNVTYGPWFRVLKGGELKVYFGLHVLRVRRGYPITKPLIFNFDQLANATGLSKNAIGENLKKLEARGLVTDLRIGTGWGTGHKGQGTRLHFVWPLPSIHKSPNRNSSY